MLKIKDIFPLYPAEKVTEFEKRKQNLRQSSLPGIIVLLRYFETTTDRESFMNRLCEFNIAHKLFEQRKPFGYETEGEDFSFDDILMSVGSLQPKEYERREAEKILELHEQAKASGEPQKESHDYKSPHSASSVSFEVTADSSARIETANIPNSLLPTDAWEEAIICQYAAEFETVPREGRKKVLLFMRQSERAAAFHVEDVARWYFGQSPLESVDSSFYEKYFKKRDGTQIEKVGSIDAFVFTWHTDPILWSKDMGQQHISIWTPHKRLEAQLTELLAIK